MRRNVSVVGMNESLVNEAIMRALKRAFGLADISRNELARRSGVSPSTIKRMWAGQFEVGLGNLVAIAGALGTTASALMKEALDEVGENEAIADAQKRLGVEVAWLPAPSDRGVPFDSVLIAAGNVSEGAAKVTDIESRRAKAETLTVDELEQMRAEGRAAASEDDDATRDEQETP